MTVEPIRLTQTVQKGGCAAKVAAAELRKILSRIQFPPAHPQLLVDGGLFDDAAIYKITDDVALVQTLDFFTPIVDSPRLFGEIASANALSDVYAMGGRPKTAMGILAFPIATMPDSVIVEVLQGSSDKIKQANACFVGGHSIDDDSLKYGLSVTGFVNPKRVWSNAGALPGDDLILTKPLGTGTLTAALKRNEATEATIVEALESMSLLNNAVDFMDSETENAVHSATDITGFGLFGHGMQLAKASGVQLEIEMASVPRMSLAMEYLEKKFLTKAHRTNREYTEESVEWQAKESGQRELHQLLFCDPQTSGGLLLAVDSRLSSRLLEQIRKGFPKAQKIGRVREKTSSSLLVV